jgi:hypothetical protein
MHISDLAKDLRRLLLSHWSEEEINSLLFENPEYFFDHVVNPRLDYLRRLGKDAPRVRLQKTPTGELKALLLP